MSGDQAQTTLARVTALVVEQLDINVEDLLLDTSLEAQGADSLDQVELAMDVEDKFSIFIPDEDLHSLTTINLIVAYVDKKLAEKVTA